jgi:hypothetical protein
MLEEVPEAHREWHTVSGQMSALLRAVPGRDAREIPTGDQLDSLRMEAKRTLTAGVPAPIPVSSVVRINSGRQRD